MDNLFKEYFTNQVNQVTIPPMPGVNKRKINPWGNILLAALSLSSMVIVYNPGSYNSRIRDLVILEENKEAIRTNFTRVVREIDIYYLEKKGVLND